MLKGIKNLTLVEASKDKLWGTGIPLRDVNALTVAKWENKGWLSSNLHNIREDIQT